MRDVLVDAPLTPTADLSSAERSERMDIVVAQVGALIESYLMQRAIFAKMDALGVFGYDIYRDDWGSRLISELSSRLDIVEQRGNWIRGIMPKEPRTFLSRLRWLFTGR